MRRYWPVTVPDVVVLALAMAVVAGLYWMASHWGACTPHMPCGLVQMPN
jgi:hypothetical protein